jgi:16S rRNA (adenine1518-N6/adenine1519-N6)-dimethyltransferase
MGVKTTLAAEGLAPRKSLGQHFLTDTRLLEKIARAADVTDADAVLEIGPGLGHLTRVLAQRAGRVVAVELDDALAAKLTKEFADAPNVRILQGDVLKLDPGRLMTERQGQIGTTPVFAYKVVANLPYYITSAVLRHLLEARVPPALIVALIQREVAQRIVAQPPHMSLLAVSVQFYAAPSVVMTIPPGAFYPPPKVTSAVVRLRLDPRQARGVEDPARFFEIVRAGFSARRKVLSNALSAGLDVPRETVAQVLHRAGLDPRRRAETLSVSEWIRVYHALIGKCGHP